MPTLRHRLSKAEEKAARARGAEILLVPREYTMEEAQAEAARLEAEGRDSVIIHVVNKPRGLGEWPA